MSGIISSRVKVLLITGHTLSMSDVVKCTIQKLAVCCPHNELVQRHRFLLSIDEAVISTMWAVELVTVENVKFGTDLANREHFHFHFVYSGDPRTMLPERTIISH